MVKINKGTIINFSILFLCKNWYCNCLYYKFSYISNYEHSLNSSSLNQFYRRIKSSWICFGPDTVSWVESPQLHIWLMSSHHTRINSKLCYMYQIVEFNLQCGVENYSNSLLHIDQFLLIFSIHQHEKLILLLRKISKLFILCQIINILIYKSKCFPGFAHW